jgi:hypothetical protein
MFFRSFFYERDVLMHLDRVRKLPAEVQAEIAMRVSNFIGLARTADTQLLQRFIQVAQAEQQRAVQLGAKSDNDPLLTAPALSEAWCRASLGLATGNLDANSAVEIIVAIEKFTAKKTSGAQPKA